MQSKTGTPGGQPKSPTGWLNSSPPPDDELGIIPRFVRVIDPDIKEMEHPEFRLRLDPYRVFYDVPGKTVVVLAIVPKQETNEWLDVHGVKSS